MATVKESQGYIFSFVPDSNMAPNGAVKKYHILFNFLNQSSDFFLLSQQPGEELSLSVCWELPIAELGQGLEALSAQAPGRALCSHTVQPFSLAL